MPDVIARPRRIQRQRTKGWRMPEGAVYVGRPGKRGNPYVIGEIFFPPASGAPNGPCDPYEYPPVLVRDRAHAAALFRELWAHLLRAGHPLAAANRAALEELRGRDLACWCQLDQPCHADVLLEIANA